MQEDNSMDFDGVFRFTNWTEEDFTAKWDSVSYTFPALKTVPLVIPKESPEGIQNIRKLFAKKLAEREFHRSARMKKLEDQTPVGSVGSFQNASSYAPQELEEYVQKCLSPLPMARAEVKVEPKKPIKLHVDEEGKPITKVVKANEKLVEGTMA